VVRQRHALNGPSPLISSRVERAKHGRNLGGRGTLWCYPVDVLGHSLLKLLEVWQPEADFDLFVPVYMGFPATGTKCSSSLELSCYESREHCE
jgi:hypothetical protein